MSSLFQNRSVGNAEDVHPAGVSRARAYHTAMDSGPSPRYSSTGLSDQRASRVSVPSEQATSERAAIELKSGNRFESSLVSISQSPGVAGELSPPEAMRLVRIHAFEVSPHEPEGPTALVKGGQVDAPLPFRQSLLRFLRKAQLERQIAVSFRPETVPGQDDSDNPVRRQVLQYVFDQGQMADDSARWLADRLSLAMDGRSSACLLVLSVYQVDDQYWFVGWAFPSDDPFGFRWDGDQAALHLIDHAFSRSSKFRKAVLFRGDRREDQFWQGHILDVQSGSAAYWIQEFLLCQRLLNGQQGTRLLAELLRETYDQMPGPEQRQQITRAVMATQAAQRKSWSIRQFANDYLSGEVKQVFLKQAPQPALTTGFELDESVLANRAGFRRFEMQDDVILIAPLSAVGESLKLSGPGRRALSYQGQVVQESVVGRLRGTGKQVGQ